MIEASNATLHAPVEDTVEAGRQLFLEALDALEPESVLDLGAGTGWVLEHCERRGVRGFGLEASGERLRELIASERKVAQAEGEHAPVVDQAVDVVALRHVLHHCRQPLATLNEAARMARRAIVISEQWWHPEHPEHTRCEALDRWTKEVHRATGFHHLPALSADVLTAALPADGWSWRIAHHAWPVEQSVDGYLAGHARFLEALPELHPLWDAGRPLIEDARRGGLWRQGTLIAVAQRESGRS